ncbi:MAG: hypothetical protein RL385_2633 [Pseudomonadota bacterium]|jgi:predicted acetyltransferase
MTTPLALVPLGPHDAVLLSHLLELYIHDLSAVFTQVKLGDDGRFGYPALSQFVAGTDGRHAYLLREAGSLAGFVLVQRGSPASADPNVRDIAEFFVLRSFRGRGLGRAAAELLWDTLPGPWVIRAAQKNAPAVRFWREVVGRYAGPRMVVAEFRPGWVAFSFDNAWRD